MATPTASETPTPEAISTAAPAPAPELLAFGAIELELLPVGGARLTTNA